MKRSIRTVLFVGFVFAMLLVLASCGKKEEAREICRRVCKNLYDNGILLGFAPMDTEVDGSPIVNWPNPTASDGWPWTTWAASSALVMLTAIMPEEGE